MQARHGPWRFQVCDGKVDCFQDMEFISVLLTFITPCHFQPENKALC
jgi:hypothetical protein